MLKIKEKLKNLMKFYITDSKDKPEISQSREVGVLKNREVAENLPIKNLVVSGEVDDAQIKKILDNKATIKCSHCGSEDFVKRGTRRKKRETVQLYLCRSCCRTFTPFSTKGKHYPLQWILEALSYYNLGFSLEQTCKIVKEKSGELEIQPSTLNNWVQEFSPLCAYSRMRPYGMKMHSPYEIVEAATLAHRQLYRFRFHRAKIRLIIE